MIPLVQYAMNVRRGGVLRFVLGDDPGALLWIVPAGILAVLVLVVMLLERQKISA